MSGVRRTVLEEKVILTWKCDHCGSKVSGLKRECPNCGMPRDRGTKFDTNDVIGTLSAEESKNYGQPDWLCECCDMLNNYRNTECESCGAPKGASKNYFEMHEEINRRKMQHDLQGSDDSTYVEERFTHSSEFDSTPMQSYHDKEIRNRRKTIFRNFLIGGGVSLGIISFIVLMVFLLKPKEYSVVVESSNWERSISIEEVNTYHEEGWSLPAGAVQTDKVWKYKDKERVIDHYDTVTEMVTKTKTVQDGYDVSYEVEDNGDGTGNVVKVETPKYKTVEYEVPETKQVPVYAWVDVYDWYYYYDIDRWSYTRSVDTRGETGPYWGEVTLRDDEREGGRTERYNIVVSGEDIDSKTYHIDYDVWVLIEPGDELVVSVNAVGICKVVSINSERVE